MDIVESVFSVSKMDCPSEEKLIKMKLEDLECIKKMDFDLANRKLTVMHTPDNNIIANRLSELNLDAKLLKQSSTLFNSNSKILNDESTTLLIVLVINLAFFVLELLYGIISKSMGLTADSLDMLADAFVYGLSLYAIGKVLKRKKQIAKLSGYFQLFLALLGFFEIFRRFIGIEEMPNYNTMIIVSLLALIANAVCLWLLQKQKSKEVHIQASMIFTSNDILINVSVIIAGILVNIFSSNLPDLIVGSIVFVIVAKGAFRILQIAK